MCTIIDDFQIGMCLINMEKPNKIIISTFDLDLSLFLIEFYNPDIEYEIFYWYILNDKDITIPSNLNLHQKERNHCKFWYIINDKQVRFILTSCNLTYGMLHNCLQSFVSFTVDKSDKWNETEFANDLIYYKKTLFPFFNLFNINLDYNLFKLLKNKLIYNIPGYYNGIEKWYLNQKHLFIDCNNITGNYLNDRNKTLIIRQAIPPNFSKIICYYSLDKINIKNTNLNSIPFNYVFHYKLYYSNDSILISSNNFSFNYKMNYELGIIINKSQ